MNMEAISRISIYLGCISSAIIIIHLIFYPQKMWIMNMVWPVTGLYAGIIGLFLYFRAGISKRSDAAAQSMHMHHEEGHKKITWQQIVKSTLHCGGGCFTGDVISEIFLLYVTVSIFQNPLFNHWLINFIFAFLAGILFQYYSIKPMKHLSTGEAIKASLKAGLPPIKHLHGECLACWGLDSVFSI
jgi:hypothetical protein